MLSARLPKALRMWVLALAILLLGSSAFWIWRHCAVAVRRCPDCGDVYQTILRPYFQDDQWTKTHVLLNTVEGSRFIAPSVVQMRSQLSWFERLEYWCELDSFLAQKEGEPLPYSGAGQQKLRLIRA